VKLESDMAAGAERADKLSALQITGRLRRAWSETLSVVKTSSLPFWLALFATLGSFAPNARPASPREEWFHNLSLENAAAGAELIVAVQVAGVTEITLMRGGKGESSMFQYKLKPVRVLKGIFAREELSLGSGDLGIYRAAEMKELKQGAFLLLFLGRSDVGYRNTNLDNNNANITRSMPPLRDANDPLLDAVRTLLAVHAELDRGKRVSLLLAGLKNASGPGAVALLDSLSRRALLAAQTPEVGAAITKHLTDPSPAVREAAAHTLRAVLEADYLEHADLREAAVAKSVEALKLRDRHVAARSAMIGVLGASGAAVEKNPEAMKQLIPEPAALGDYISFAEIAAQFRALGQLKAKPAGADATSFLRQTPLDVEGDLARAAGFAASHIRPDDTPALLKSRLERKIAAGLDGQIEIESFADLPPERAIPALVEISKLPLNDEEKAALADTCRQLTEQQPDARLVEPLAGLLAPDEPGRESAILALLKIDTDDAAKALQPHLREEQNLFRKLQIAEMLGRHGFRDGYTFAIEHMSEPWLLEQAVAALAAIKEPQAAARLKEILETSNDLGWNAAAVRALGALGAQEMAPKFLAMIEDLKNPLAPAALIALGDLGERKALEKARDGFASRNDQVVTASARAAGKLLALPDVRDDDLRNKLAALLGDADAGLAPRTAALNALLALNDERLNAALAKVVRDSKIEGSDLMQRVEKLLRERKVKL
jgi:HEAT repeat protein